MWHYVLENTFPPGWPLSGSDADRPLLADCCHPPTPPHPITPGHGGALVL